MRKTSTNRHQGGTGVRSESEVNGGVGSSFFIIQLNMTANGQTDIPTHTHAHTHKHTHTQTYTHNRLIQMHACTHTHAQKH